jgi:putative oxygen-independent coproporphyrinogen III oxidase
MIEIQAQAQGSALSLPPLALYVHLPWCVRKCPYCDFNSHQQPKVIPEAEYINALMRDLDQDLPSVWGRPIVSIFFGGGTPSLFSGRGIAAILDGVRARLKLRPDAEITLETNPGAAEFDRFEAYLAAGVNRLSFGFQSFDDEKLKRLGRVHSSAEARAAFEQARRAGINNINIDLMYALPAQTQMQALEDVRLAMDLAPEHISHYHLTMEPDTVFAKFPPADLPDEDSAWDMQEACQLQLKKFGYEQYEVSAYAKADQRSVHNQVYWRFGDYLGIGAGAHAKITDLNTGLITRTAKQKIPRLYQDTAGTAISFSERRVLSGEGLAFEFVLNALRLVEGFPERDFALRTGLELNQQAGFARAMQKGLLERVMQPQGAYVRATELGQRFLNDLINEFS